ncbi:uncharacterized protein LOC131875243 [Cryptomeria japonica]|uniref:uncharacterized protein LOC131875243 n=1 Tax=Cryptomeria japonica TaxID=3369 RepID=UPI0027DA4CF5|nr:uncharacterized protein LOC131875243 [Cryptomeria japonica]
MVYLRLQPYRQSSLKKSGAKKLRPQFYGPYRVIRRVGEVAYEIELPEGSRVHIVFHVSRLKKAIGQGVVPSADLPLLDEEGRLVLIPTAISDVRERTLRNRIVKEYLINHERRIDKLEEYVVDIKDNLNNLVEISREMMSNSKLRD